MIKLNNVEISYTGTLTKCKHSVYWKAVKVIPRMSLPDWLLLLLLLTFCMSRSPHNRFHGHQCSWKITHCAIPHGHGTDKWMFINLFLSTRFFTDRYRRGCGHGFMVKWMLHLMWHNVRDNKIDLSYNNYIRTGNLKEV